jgi:hypothetical protein
VDESLEAVLITGVFGSGKSSAAVEIAHELEQRQAPFALLDLDFLGWFGPDDEEAYRRVLMRNISAVAGNYKEAGVRFFVLAHAIEGLDDLAAIRAALAMPMKVVRLEVPLATIRKRLSSDVTAGRQDDLRRAEDWLATGRGAGLEDFCISNEGPIGEVADDILAWLGWLG